jgi:hypothetical protein
MRFRLSICTVLLILDLLRALVAFGAPRDAARARKLIGNLRMGLISFWCFSVGKKLVVGAVEVEKHILSKRF